MESNTAPLTTLNANRRIPSESNIINKTANNIYGGVILPPVQGDTEASAKYTLAQMKNKIIYADGMRGLENKGSSTIVRWK